VSVVANVAINVDSRNAVSQLRAVETRAQATEKAFGALQQAAAAFGAGFALSKVIADVKELDTNLRRLGTVGGNVQALDKGLGGLSKQLDGIANKAELAAASYQALSAGFTETGANLKIVEAATKAAVGGLVDVTSVVEVTTKTLNAYGLSGEHAIKVTDSISKAIEYGQVQWSDYTSQLGRVAATAALAGVSIDEVNAFVAAATKNGATAEVAFTGLSAALATLLKPTKESQEAAAALGIEWNIGGLQAKGFSGLLADLSKKQDANKTAVAALLGSQEALRGVLAANSKSGKDYQIILDGLGKAAGKTDADFKAMKNSLDNQLKALDTAFKNLSEALGKAFGPSIIQVISDITGLVNGFADAINAVPQPVAKAIAEIVRLVAQMLLLQKAIQGIIALRTAIVGMFAATAATAGTAATATSGLTMNMRYLRGSMVEAKTQASGLVGALRNLTSFGIITVGINLVVNGLQDFLTAVGETQKLRGERAAGGVAAIYGKTATAEQKQTAAATLKAVRAEQARYQDPRTIAAQTVLGPASRLFGIPTTAEAGARRTVLMERAAKAQATLGLGTRTETVTNLSKPDSTTQNTFDTGDAKGKTPKGSESQISALQNELDLQNRLLQLVNQTGQARLSGNKTIEAALEIERILEERSTKIAEINLEKIPAAEKELKIKTATAEADQQLASASIERQLAEQDRQKQLEEIVQNYADETALLMAASPEIRKKLELEQQINKWKKDGVIKTEQEAAGIRAANAELEKQRQIREKLNAQQQMEFDLYQGIANTVAQSFSNAFDTAIAGTENLGQALGKLGTDLLATINKMLIMYAIAQALGALGGGADNPQGILSFLARGFGYKGAKDGAYWTGGFKAFADGGMVTRPTMGLVGEGGEPEYIIPASKMAGAMARYSAGARGSNVIPDSSAPSGGGAGGSNTITLETVVINNVEYATVDQVREFSAVAARQGAEGGYNRSMSTLRNSRSQRSRIGLR